MAGLTYERQRHSKKPANKRKWPGYAHSPLHVLRLTKECGTHYSENGEASVPVLQGQTMQSFPRDKYHLSLSESGVQGWCAGSPGRIWYQLRLIVLQLPLCPAWELELSRAFTEKETFL